MLNEMTSKDFPSHRDKRNGSLYFSFSYHLILRDLKKSLYPGIHTLMVSMLVVSEFIQHVLSLKIDYLIGSVAINHC